MTKIQKIKLITIKYTDYGEDENSSGNYWEEKKKMSHIKFIKTIKKYKKDITEFSWKDGTINMEAYS